MLSARWGENERAVFEAIEEARAAGVVERIWRRDSSLWSDDPEVQAKIANRLGWLDVPAWVRGRLGEIRGGAGSIPHVMLLGMGGSSLAPEVISRTYGVLAGHGRSLTVLDSTSPEEIRATESAVDLAKTSFFVSSKSGETIETRSHAAYFIGRAGDASRFVAITDSGSPLETMASQQGFRHVFLNPPDIGGRYSALSFFGLAPSTAIGIDPEPMLARAASAQDACRALADNPGLELGVALAELARRGRDKVTFVASPGLESFGAWAEQLLAESTGKDGKGLIPVDGEPLGTPDRYGGDRVFVHLRLRGSRANEKALRTLERAGHPVVTMPVADAHDLGALFFLWEFATAVAGWRLGVDPFDEPNVAESKQNTARLIETYQREGALPASPPAARARAVELYGVPGEQRSVVDALRTFLHAARPGDYVALQAFVPRNDVTAKALREIRTPIRDVLRRATTAGFGPRFLHSTGQLHKGGPPTGVFMQITAARREDVPIPGAAYTFGVLQDAQAAGDFDSLVRHGRPVARVHLRAGAGRGLTTLARLVREALAT